MSADDHIKLNEEALAKSARAIAAKQQRGFHHSSYEFARIAVTAYMQSLIEQVNQPCEDCPDAQQP